MRPTQPKLGRTSHLISSLPEMGDTSPVQANLTNFLERAKNPAQNSMMEKIVRSGLIEAVAFPVATPCLELVLECMNRYGVEQRCIRAINEEVLLKIDRETVMASMGIPHKESYEDWTIGTSYSFFFEKKSTYKSVIARYWLLKIQKGGSRLPRPLTRENFITKVWDIVILLNKLKGNAHAF